MSATSGANGAGTTSRILDVAERMLQVRGYNGFSYGDVAAELDITRAALHYHFKGKAELGQALIERYAARFADALAHLDATAPDAAAKLRGYADLYTDVLSADRMCLCGMLAAEHRTLPDPLQQAVCAFFASNTAWLRRVLEEGCADGSLRCPGTPEDTASMVLGALEGAMLITRLDGDVARFTATANQLLAGLSPVPVRDTGTPPSPRC
ncbi:TetR/AcrR family transcriptional regulator [Blastococcus sp. CT_GayMR19]|uniref:TetR/AcrR family transcriptional regulator n=1 Tax=Blastococcus sp. CT_GayMR19 TaxID=2559608 RepID=UPI0010746047|nr:TetR/AcrR family transcriptional regulator [Blastococcus sp. CT_GayMR19]TFV69960.1 TetR/AcrR family transcriptional regulator [Blastococcus sp. CT_GayMR19]